MSLFRLGFVLLLSTLSACGNKVDRVDDLDLGSDHDGAMSVDGHDGSVTSNDGGMETSVTCADVQAMCAGANACCVGSTIAVCNPSLGVGVLNPCAGTVNPVCTMLFNDPECDAVPASSSCNAGGGPTCMTYSDGFDYVLSCVTYGNGMVLATWSKCTDGLGGPTACMNGMCETGAACTGTSQTCSGNALVECEDDFEKISDCTGETCETGLGGAGCVQAGSAPCMPTTFEASCSPEGAPQVCLPFGWTGTRDPCTQGETCTVSPDGHDANCCLPPGPGVEPCFF